MKSIVIVSLFLIQSFILYGQRKTLDFDSLAGSPQASLQDITWLAGHWRGEALGGIVEEIWTPALGGSMMCAFKLVKDNEVQFYEIVTLVEENQSLHLRLKHFNNDLTGWEEKDETVDFPLVKMEKDRAYFDGFTFEKIGQDSLHIYVVLSSKDGIVNEALFPYGKLK